MEIESILSHDIIKVTGNTAVAQHDVLAVEQPLQIELQFSSATGRMNKNIAVTMRTPGNDSDLAAGFLFTESIISSYGSIASLLHVHNDENRLLVVLKENIVPRLHQADRNFYTSSSCGVCGKASIDAVKTTSVFKEKIQFVIDAGILYFLQDKVLQQQEIFESTGGLHAAALFDLKGNFIQLKEDVGRHNALDKLIGASMMNDQLPLSNSILFLSGRASFELVQKATMAGIKMIVAVGAPSSLAVELAQENDITLVGFLRKGRFNIYCGIERIKI